MERPSIQVLQEFTKLYFKRRCPVVRWKRVTQKDPWMGKVDLQKNIIYLDPVMSDCDGGFMVGMGISHKPKGTFKYKPGEQYFHTLLHEIAHFKIKPKPSKEWIVFKRQLFREAKQSIKWEKIGRERAGLEPLKLTKKGEEAQIWQMVNDAAQTMIKPKEGEQECDYLGRLEEFRHWLAGGCIVTHIEVEDWGRVEFKKRRKEIAKLLSS
jgi:hypothetical protein